MVPKRSDKYSGPPVPTNASRYASAASFVAAYMLRPRPVPPVSVSRKGKPSGSSKAP